ncbi:phage tail assembly protein [Selenomonas artemidis]|uniref:phage tail assembly protein n=1 Tax=Selenomonas artemidis TaxID=671224 RepID=UPI0028D3420C|nr:phage tail assembly protein [Selenomonas artemidis]
MKITLTKPVTYKEQEYKQLNIDLDGLNGLDLMKANAAQRGNPDNVVPALSMGYQAQVAALAAKVPIEVIEHLAAPDFVKVTIEVQRFLLGRD